MRSLLSGGGVDGQQQTLHVAVLVAMPGLVQTLDHARASYQQSIPALRPHEIEHRTSFRIKRQAILHGERPVPYTALIHEAALHMQTGSPAVMYEQLHHLAEMSQQPNISLRVVPFARTNFPVSGQPISYATGPVPQLDTVLLDSDHRCEYIDAEAQVARYRCVLDRMEDCALPPGKSRSLILRIASGHRKD